VASRDLQIDFAEEWYRAFDRIIDLLVDEGRADEALALAERSHAHILAEELKFDPSPAGAVDSLRSIIDRLPDGVVVLVFESLERTTVAWVVRRSSIVCKRLPLGQAELERLVPDGHIGSEKEPEAVTLQRLESLYEAIYRPVSGSVRETDRLVFVPDKSLQLLPFAALRDASRGRWLIEEHAVSVAPSLTHLVSALERDGERRHFGRERILVVGDPAFDSSRFPDLPRLSSAAAEARDIAKLYDDADTLLGANAVRSRVLEQATGRSVIHLAVHSLLNPRHPSRSALLFAPDTQIADDGIFYAFQIDARAFSSTRLLVLGGCSTSSGKRTVYEGPLSLSRAFLAAGIPDIVATLWDVDDDASREMLLPFHKGLRQGSDAVAALRTAQLHMIHHRDARFRRVDAWAGFQVIGGFFEK
jgi:CHAT domain-containing protein